MKWLLRHISRRDRVPPSRLTCKILTSTGSGDLIPRLLDFRRTNFDLEAFNLFSDGVYEEEEEGDHRLDALMNHSSSWSPELFHRTPRRGCATITYLCVLPESVWCRRSCRASCELLGDFILLPWWNTKGGGIGLFVQESWRR